MYNAMMTHRFIVIKVLWLILTRKALKLTILFLLCIHFINGQTTELVLLKKTKGNVPFAKGLVPTKLDTSNTQYVYPEMYTQFIIKYITFNPNDKNYPSWKYSILIGMYKSDSIVVIVDINQNNDFTDDESFLYPKDSSLVNESKLPSVTVKIDYAGNRQNFTFQPYPYKTAYTYNKKKEEEFYLMIKSFEHMAGEIYINDKRYELKVANPRPSPIFNLKQNIQVSISDKMHSKTYGLEELIKLANDQYIIQKLSPLGDTLYIKNVSKDLNNQYGYTQGLKLRKLTTLDIYNNIVVIPDIRKLTLLDFWGTWCLPCKELTPALKLIEQQYKSDLNIISVAYDKNIVDVKKYLVSQQIKWPNLYQSFNKDNHSLIDNFNISGYPTFLLIDNNGKIIYRGEGKEALEKIENILKLQ